MKESGVWAYLVFETCTMDFIWEGSMEGNDWMTRVWILDSVADAGSDERNNDI